MRKIILFAFTVFMVSAVSAQDFSNKGKDFWVGYGYHQQMTNGGGGGSQDMVLYFATEQVTNITITIPGTGYTQNITTAAGNNVVTSATIPKTGANDARLFTEGLSNKGIHVTSDKPMVAYAHVYNQSVSGATILFPTNTLGREYYSVNYKNWSNSLNSNCWFYVVAADTGTTKIEITPTGNTTGGWISGTTYTVTLTQGQIYNVMGSLISSPNNCNPVCTGYDLTGSKIKSVNTGSGCKKIAVFSGSGRISITCNNNNSSSDNYMVQAMPKTAWGKKYLTVPANGNQANNIYRVCVSDPATIVKINGAVTALPLLNGFYYEIPSTNQPQSIEADSAIMVAQYFTSQNACGNGATGDPEMIYLSSVEQNISKVLWNATPNFLITTHNFNVVLPNSGTAVSSFRLDGAAVGGFVAHPQDANYVYLKRNVTAGFHIIQSDSGFNAIAYGFGNAESYGYNAGTNIKDLYQQIGVKTTYGIETAPSVCTNSPFKFKVSLPYIPDSMHWNFNGAVGMSPNNNTVYVDNTANIAEDSFTVVNGKTIHWYSIPLQYTFSTIGVYPITITTFVPNSDCGSIQDIDFDLAVSDPPTASFNAVVPGCYLEPVVATETTPQTPKATYRQWWEFYDPVTNLTTVFSGNGVRVVTHTFTTPGVKRIRHSSITTPGCLSDTIVQMITLQDIPNATVAGNTTVCINSVASVPVTFTGTLGTAEYIFSYNINGGGTLTTPPSTGGSYTINAPANVAGTFTYNLTGVRNENPAGTPCTRNITGQSITVNITPDATITLRAGDNNNQTVCINNPIAIIRYDIGGSGTGASIVFTPALPGVTGNYAGGVFTITGTPTLNGVFNYTISTTGPCITPTATGTITVTDNATLALTSAPGTDNQTLCINVPLVNITYSVAGSGTGGSVSGLPAGVTGTFAAGVITITGTPTVSGIFNYTVSTTGPCVIPTATGTITVRADATITLTSAVGTNNQTRCINTAITNITYAVGGSGTGAVVSGLPAGVTGSFAGGVVTITGTPTAAGTFNYTVTTTGPCIIPTATGTITVTDNATLTLTSAVGTDNQTLCINTAIINITYSVAGSGTGGSVSGLPAGVTGSFVGGVITITGTPTVSGIFNYTVNTTGPCVIPTVTGRITVTADATLNLTSAVGTDNQTRCVNTAITNITYAVGGSGTGATVSGLPAGVTGTFAGGVVTIAGTPTASGTFNYTVTTTGPCVIPTATGTITVTNNATLALTSAPGTDNQTLCINIPLINITYSVAGTGTGGSVSGLPAGVTGSFAAGVITITGTPTVSGIFNYTVSTTGPCVIPTATGRITVTGDATLTLTSAAGTNNQTRCINTAITNITYTVGGSGTGGSVSGLPPGVTGVFAGGVITISGTPTSTAGSPYTYTVTTTGPCVIPTATGTITVNPDASITLTSAASTTSQELCRNSTITNITYSITGGGTGATVSGLPAGVTGVYAGGVFTISGSPTVAGLFNYTVTTTGTCVQNSLSGSILVNQLPTASFTYTTPSCATRTISFTDASVPNSGVLTNWSWNFGDASPLGTTQNPTHVYAAAGIYTVTLTVTTNKGCISNPIASVPVTINSRPLAGFIIPEVCLSDTYAQFTDTSTLANAVINRWDWNFGDPGSGPLNTSTLQNPTHSYSAVGSYSVRLIVWNFALGCRDTITQILTVNGSFPIANFTVNNPATLCANDSVGIVEASTVFPGVITKVEIYWDNVGFPAVFQIDNNPFTGKVYRHLYPNFQAPLTKTFTIRYRAYSGGVCVNDKFRNITVNAAPLVQFNNIPNTCYLVAPFQLTQPGNGGVPGTGVFSGPGVSPSGIFNPQAAGVGTHTILYTYTSSAAGCVDTMSKTITVLDTAHAVFGVTLPSCEQVPTIFTDLSTAPASVTLLNTVWDFGDLTGLQTYAIGSPISHVYAGPGPYTVIMHTVSNDAPVGCLSKDTSALINIDPNHGISLLSANNNQTLCVNNAIAPIRYQLSGGATNIVMPPAGLPPGVTASLGAGNVVTLTGTPTLAGTYNYSIQTTGNTCVVANASGVITVKPDHAISWNATSGNQNQSLCVNVAIQDIEYQLSGGATNIVMPPTGLPPGVTASLGAGNIITITGTPTLAGTYNYSIQTTGNNCVVANASGVITVKPDHTISLNAGSNANQAVCINTPITDIVYTLGGGATGAIITPPLPTGVNYVVTGNTLTISGTPSPAAGGPIFPFTITTTGNSCVLATSSGSISVAPDDIIAFTSGDTMQSVCVNTAIDPIVYTIGGGATNVTISGLPSGVNYSVSGNTVTISGTPNATGGPSFPYVISTNGICVQDTADGEITVNPYPIPNFAVDKPSYCIPNAIVIFNNSSVMPDGSGMTYLWNFGEPSSGGSNTSSAVNPSHWYSGTGPFNVNLSVSSVAVLNGGIIGCSHDTTIVVNTIHPQPKADFAKNKPSVCIGDNVTFTDNTNGGGIIQQSFWNMGDGSPTQNGNPFTYLYRDTLPSPFIITYYAQDNLGCNSDTITRPFYVYPYPHVNAGPDRFVLEGGSILLETVTFANDPQYAWTPATYLDDSRIARPRVTDPKTDMTYRLTITARGGCTLSDDVFVKLLRFPVIPNTFSPNNDGINDKWRIDYLNTYPNNRVQIFTRNGNLVFESRGYNTAWDGTFKGKPLPFDTYYYIIEPGNGRDPITGYVTILK